MLAALAAALLAAAPQDRTPPPEGNVVRQVLSPPGQNLSVWLPRDYKSDEKVALKFDRKPTATSNEAVSLRIALTDRKIPAQPAVPTEADLLKVDPSLSFVKFNGSIGTWNGRAVPTGRYEAFVPGNKGVYGRIIWLPLEPGTVALSLYAEPVWMDALNRDYDVILGGLSGPIVEQSLRERAPNRWLVSVILLWLGGLVAVIGIFMLIARMNDAFDNSLTYLGLFLPIVPIGFGVLNLPQCWKGLLVTVVGSGMIGLSFLVGR